MSRGKIARRASPSIGSPGREQDFKSRPTVAGDTERRHGKLLLTVLGSLAKFERTLILRTSEARACAKTAGVRFGNRLELTAFQIHKAKRRLKDGESQYQIALPVWCKPSTHTSGVQGKLSKNVQGRELPNPF